MIHLYYWMEMPVAEIAQVLTMKEGTVKSHLYRARRQLGRRLGDAAEEKIRHER